MKRAINLANDEEGAVGGLEPGEIPESSSTEDEEPLTVQVKSAIVDLRTRLNAKRAKIECVNCGMNHKMYQCRLFLALNLEERNFDQLRLCANCFQYIGIKSRTEMCFFLILISIHISYKLRNEMRFFFLILI